MSRGDSAPPSPRLVEDIALLAAYLLSSGRGLLQEPPDYGAIRCADAARRALETLEEHGVHEPRLTAVRARLDDIMFAPMGGSLDISDTLDELCGMLADALRETTSS
ncbi:DUF6092 family protein [Streptomyces sp. URMC 123]|uniref:DUF6092 family protein n=1 Tax=Streptomyces sp. URMC 123 TaxID=3423403 RepID=UPI003F1BC6B5